MIDFLRLENFIPFKYKELNFSKSLNIIRGPNGAGKSSILDALFLLLTGRFIRNITHRNAIKKNETHYIVSARIKDLFICRSYLETTNESSIYIVNSDNPSDLKYINSKECQLMLSKYFDTPAEFLNYKNLIKYTYYSFAKSQKFHSLEFFEEMFPFNSVKEQIDKKYEILLQETAKLEKQIDFLQIHKGIITQASRITPQKIKKLENEIAELNTTYYNLKDLLKNYKIVLNQNQCPTCKRKVSTSFKKKAKQQIKDISTELDKLHKILDEKNKQYKKYISLIEQTKIVLPQDKTIEDIYNEFSHKKLLLDILKNIKRNYSKLKLKFLTSFLNNYKYLIENISLNVFESYHSLRFDEDQIFYTDSSGIERSFQQLSLGEKIKANILLLFLILYIYREIPVHFLFFDEIFDHLDDNNFEKVLRFLLKNEFKKQIFLVTHRDISKYHLIDLQSENVIEL